MYTIRIGDRDAQVQDLPTLAAMAKAGQIGEDAAVYDQAAGQWRTVGAVLAPPAGTAAPKATAAPQAAPAPPQPQAAKPFAPPPSYKGVLILRHPTTGDQRKFGPQTVGTYMFLFGPFYLLYHKVWLHGFLSLAATLLLSLAVPGPWWIFWMFFGKKLIVNRYLRAGYEVVAHYPDGKVPKATK